MSVMYFLLKWKAELSLSYQSFYFLNTPLVLCFFHFHLLTFWTCHLQLKVFPLKGKVSLSSYFLSLEFFWLQKFSDKFFVSFQIHHCQCGLVEPHILFYIKLQTITIFMHSFKAEIQRYCLYWHCSNCSKNNFIISVIPVGSNTERKAIAALFCKTCHVL